MSENMTGKIEQPEADAAELEDELSDEALDRKAGLPSFSCWYCKGQ
jgi:hypothetical protein